MKIGWLAVLLFSIALFLYGGNVPDEMPQHDSTVSCLPHVGDALVLAEESGGKIYRYEERSPAWLKNLLLTLMIVWIIVFLRQRRMKGVIFGLIGLVMVFVAFYTLQKKQAVFDLEKQLFYKGSATDRTDTVPFLAIKAFEVSRSTKCEIDTDDHFKHRKCFDVYLLDLLLKDGGREGIVCRTELKPILRDAKILATALQKPLINDAK